MTNDRTINRRNFISAGVAATAVLLLAGRADSVEIPMKPVLTLYVGTYTTNTASEGIYICDFNTVTGGLKLRQTVKNVADPSFLAIDERAKYLYAVNELVEYEGEPSGSVSAFAIDGKTGSLEFLNKVSSRGGAPCHVSVSRDGKYLLVANYLGGNIACFPIDGGGALGASVGLIQHTGSGPNKDRQLAPHAHSITLDRKNRFAIAADLGIDRLMIYSFNPKSGKLNPNAAQAFYQSKPGSGPRHFAFHPGGKLAFVINELDSTITSLAFSSVDGTLREIQTLSTLSPEFTGVSFCADVHVSPDGKFLYGSNRGQDSIAVFAIDDKTGKLVFIENTPTGGKRPRNFIIDPTGNFLLAANQDTGNIVVFRIDKKTGKLQQTENSISIPAPVCLKLI